MLRVVQPYPPLGTGSERDRDRGAGTGGAEEATDGGRTTLVLRLSWSRFRIRIRTARRETVATRAAVPQIAATSDSERRAADRAEDRRTGRERERHTFRLPSLLARASA